MLLVTNSCLYQLQFEKFVSILTSNVVDSNMLIRCLVLSQEHFMSNRFYSGKEILIILFCPCSVQKCTSGNISVSHLQYSVLIHIAFCI